MYALGVYKLAEIINDALADLTRQPSLTSSHRCPTKFSQCVFSRLLSNSLDVRRMEEFYLTIGASQALEKRKKFVFDDWKREIMFVTCICYFTAYK